MRGTKFLALALITSAAAFSNVAMASGHACYPSGSGSTPTCDDDALGSFVYDLHDGSENIDYASNVADATDSSDSSVYVTVNGVDVYIETTTWSDSGTGSYDWYSEGNDNLVKKQGNLTGYYDSASNDYGYGLSSSEYRDGHTIDNVGDYYSGSDFDMVLFSFSQAVSLTGATFTWLETNNKDKEITVVGLNDLSVFGNSSFTWADIALNSVVTSGHFLIGEECDDVFTSVFTGLGEAKYWLVGAYNTVFDNNAISGSEVGFKLASLGLDKTATTPGSGSNEASAPGSLALLMLGGGLLAWRRKRAA